MPMLAEYTQFLVEEDGAKMSEFEVRVLPRARQLSIEPGGCRQLSLCTTIAIAIASYIYSTIASTSTAMAYACGHAYAY